MHGALEYARQHIKEDDVMVVILPDHGTRYLNKIYNDVWMKDHGFLEQRQFATARDIIRARSNGAAQLITVNKNDTVGFAIKMLNKAGISQLPVADGDNIVGSLNDSALLNILIDNPDAKDLPVSEVMGPPFRFVGIDNTVDALSGLIDKENKALLVRDEANQVHIITQHDLLVALTN
jgi:cystathionine beta-synthase